MAYDFSNLFGSQGTSPFPQSPLVGLLRGFLGGMMVRQQFEERKRQRKTEDEEHKKRLEALDLQVAQSRAVLQDRQAQDRLNAMSADTVYGDRLRPEYRGRGLTVGQLRHDPGLASLAIFDPQAEARQQISGAQMLSGLTGQPTTIPGTTLSAAFPGVSLPRQQGPFADVPGAPPGGSYAGSLPPGTPVPTYQGPVASLTIGGPKRTTTLGDTGDPDFQVGGRFAQYATLPAPIDEKTGRINTDQFAQIKDRLKSAQQPTQRLVPVRYGGQTFTVTEEHAATLAAEADRQAKQIAAGTEKKPKLVPFTIGKRTFNITEEHAATLAAEMARHQTGTAGETEAKIKVDIINRIRAFDAGKGPRPTDNEYRIVNLEPKLKITPKDDVTLREQEYDAQTAKATALEPGPPPVDPGKDATYAQTQAYAAGLTAYRQQQTEYRKAVGEAMAAKSRLDSARKRLPPPKPGSEPPAKPGAGEATGAQQRAHGGVGKTITKAQLQDYARKYFKGDYGAALKKAQSEGYTVAP